MFEETELRKLAEREAFPIPQQTGAASSEYYTARIVLLSEVGIEATIMVDDSIKGESARNDTGSGEKDVAGNEEQINNAVAFLTHPKVSGLFFSSLSHRLC